MIDYVLDNLTNAPESVIIHGCNAQSVMGSGVAKDIREKWPYVYDVYHNIHRNKGLTLGQVVWVPIDDKLIGNCITQYNYGYNGQYVNYDAVRQCLREVNTECKLGGYTSVAMPKMGAGRGGGSWKTIEDIVEEELTFPKVKVYYL